MTYELVNKTGVITGSTRGLGFELAMSLAKNGAKIGINGRKSNVVHKSLKSHENFFPAVANVLVDEELISLSRKLEEDDIKLDFLICNIGGGSFNNLDLDNIDRFRYMFELNLFTTINSIRILSQNLKKPGSKILIISSTAVYGNSDAPLEYILGKFALQKYIRSIAKDLAKDGILINTLILGNFLFPYSVWDTRLKESPNTTTEYINKRVPLKKFGSIDDISHLTTFLLSDKNSFIVGAEILIDGGQAL